eukprot:NODE_669_length_4885_cov_0.982449.p2 type:complete len:329 gc:universal NODE_669_length_4885_cov_0.982449:4500-3514(-)
MLLTILMYAIPQPRPSVPMNLAGLLAAPVSGAAKSSQSDGLIDLIAAPVSGAAKSSLIQSPPVDAATAPVSEHQNEKYVPLKHSDSDSIESKDLKDKLNDFFTTKVPINNQQKIQESIIDVATQYKKSGLKVSKIDVLTEDALVKLSKHVTESSIQKLVSIYNELKHFKKNSRFSIEISATIREKVYNKKPTSTEQSLLKKLEERVKAENSGKTDTTTDPTKGTGDGKGKRKVDGTVDGTGDGKGKRKAEGDIEFGHRDKLRHVIDAAGRSIAHLTDGNPERFGTDIPVGSSVTPKFDPSTIEGFGKPGKPGDTKAPERPKGPEIRVA